MTDDTTSKAERQDHENDIFDRGWEYLRHDHNLGSRICVCMLFEWAKVLDVAVNKITEWLEARGLDYETEVTNKNLMLQFLDEKPLSFRVLYKTYVRFKVQTTIEISDENPRFGVLNVHVVDTLEAALDDLEKVEIDADGRSPATDCEEN